MNIGDQEPNIGEFHIRPELNQLGNTKNANGKEAMMSIYENEDSECEMQSLPKADNEGIEVFNQTPAAASNEVLRRCLGANGTQEENWLEEPELERIGLREGEEGGPEDNADYSGRLRAFQGSGEVRVASRNRNSSDVEYVDDDGASSICSENIYSSADFMSLPRDAHSKWSTLGRNTKTRRRERESLLESLEKQRRESVESRLKELRIPNKRHSSVSSSLSTSEMPIIAKSSPMKNATLPKQMRRTSYQSVIVTPSLFAKSGLSVAKPLLLGLSPEMRERRGSLVMSPHDVQTLSGSGTESFPLRAAGSLSCIEHFDSPRKRLILTKPIKPLPSEMQTRRPDDDAVDSNETLDSSLSTKRQPAMNRDKWSDASPLENGCLKTYLGLNLKEVPIHPRQDSFSNRIEQIRDSNVSENSGDASEAESKSVGDSPINSRKVYSATDALLPVETFRPSSGETMETRALDKQVRSVSATDRLPDRLLNGNYSLKRELLFDKNSDTSSTDNDDKHYDRKNFATQNLQGPGSIDAHREDKSTLGNAVSCLLQTSSSPHKTLLPSDHLPEKEMESKTNARRDLDDTRPRNAHYKDSVNQNKVPLYPSVSRRYFSDIKIQVKEVEPVFPPRFVQPSTNAACNGESRDDLPKDRNQNHIDDDLEKVTPNWSSYPGPLPAGFPSSHQNGLGTTSKLAEEGNFTSEAPERNVSTLEINLQPPLIDEREKVSTKEASPTVSCRYESYSSDQSRSKASNVLSSRDVDVDFRPKLSFSDRRQRIIVQNMTGEDDDRTPPKSVERNEMFVRQDDSTPSTARTLTLPRYQRSRSWNQFESQTRESPGTPQQQQELADGVRSGTPDDLSVEVTPSKANVTRITFYSKKDEQRTNFRDGERTRSSFEAIGGITTTPGDSWRASVVKREDRWRDYRTSAESSGRSAEKTPSVERIWESLEQPRTRLTKRSIRLGSDSEVVGSSTETPQSLYLQRGRRSPSSGVEANGDALIRSISLQDPMPGGGHVGESVLDIAVLKGGLGLGFCIEGGKDGPYGDRPITVKRLFRGSSDSKFNRGDENSLRAGDEILSANGRDMTLLSRFVAWNFLKTLPEGMIQLVVKRRSQQPDANQLQ